MNIFEAIGIAYTVLATALFTVQLSYFCAKGLSYLRHLIARGQAEEKLDLERSATVKRELEKIG